MKLHFHGQDYEDAYIEWQVTEGEVRGKYRGVPWKVHRSKEQHRILDFNTQLVYRGVHYINTVKLYRSYKGTSLLQTSH